MIEGDRCFPFYGDGSIRLPVPRAAPGLFVVHRAALAGIVNSNRAPRHPHPLGHPLAGFQKIDDEHVVHGVGVGPRGIVAVVPEQLIALDPRPVFSVQ